MYKSVFSKELQQEIRNKFAFLDYDPSYGKRCFFDNAGGSLRLSSSITVQNSWDLLPDCPLRYHDRAKDLNNLMDTTTHEILSTMLGAKDGSLVVEISASAVFFKVARTIIENVPGKNVVTTNIEHPSAYDSVKIFAEKMGLEFRVAEADVKTGFVNPQSIADLVDQDTVLVSVIAASNISGNIMDLNKISELIHEKKNDVYFISDCVQHAPHGIIDVEKSNLDFVNFAPYKFFATRGVGFGYVSDRVANLKHDKLEGKDSNDWLVGTPTPSIFASMLEVIDYVCWIGAKYTSSTDRRELYLEGIEKIEQQEKYLLELLLEGDSAFKGLRHIEGVNVFVDIEDLTNRDLIIAIGFDKISPTEAVTKYAQLGITVFDRINTSIYSKRIVEAIGLTGAIRVSPLHCHNEDDIHEFLIATQKIVNSL